MEKLIVISDNPRIIPDNPGYPSFWNGCLQYKFNDDSVVTQCTDSHRNFLKKYIENIKEGIIVEIGLLGGASALHLYDTCKENNNKFYGIDPFEKINIYNGVESLHVSEQLKNDVKKFFYANKTTLNNIIKKYNLNDVITIMDNESWLSSDKFNDNSINLIHVDGDHSMEGVYKDLKMFWPKIAKNGVIVGDDYTWISVQNGLNKFCEEYGIKYSVFEEKFIIVKN